MKQILHVLLLSLFAIATVAQNDLSHDRIFSEALANPNTPRPKITIYPNPATNFISAANNESIWQIRVYNLVGRQLKSFIVTGEGERYDIADLPQGMYLIQVIDKSKKIITTVRITKR